MPRFFLALTAASFVAAAGPASALSLQVTFPYLTYPPQPSPEASTGCIDLTTVSGETCSVPSK